MQKDLCLFGRHIENLEFLFLPTYEHLKRLEDAVLEGLKKRRHEESCVVLQRGGRRDVHAAISF